MARPTPMRQALEATDSNANIISLLNPATPLKPKPVLPEVINLVSPASLNKRQEETRLPIILPPLPPKPKPTISRWAALDPFADEIPEPLEAVRPHDPKSSNKRKAGQISEVRAGREEGGGTNSRRHLPLPSWTNGSVQTVSKGPATAARDVTQSPTVSEHSSSANGRHDLQSSERRLEHLEKHGEAGGEAGAGGEGNPRSSEVQPQPEEPPELDCDRIRELSHIWLSHVKYDELDFISDLVQVYQHELRVRHWDEFKVLSGPDAGRDTDFFRSAFKYFTDNPDPVALLADPIKPPRKKHAPNPKLKKYCEVARRCCLEGEDTLAVLIFDDCDEIRRKIRAHLAEPDVRQAGFLQNIGRTYASHSKVTPKLLHDFLGLDGPAEGKTSVVFYSSYVFFEKLRLEQGEEKSEHRLEMERLYGEKGGFIARHSSNLGALEYRPRRRYRPRCF